MKQAQSGIKNIYMELGSTFAQLVTTHPAVCAHLLGQIIEAFGVDHVLWGTDSIWYGSPQWQIEAFRRFQIPDQLIDQHRYQPLTRQVKERIFGLNAARVFSVDAKAKRNEIPNDYLSRVKMSYRDEASPRATAGTAGGGLTPPARPLLIGASRRMPEQEALDLARFRLGQFGHHLDRARILMAADAGLDARHELVASAGVGGGPAFSTTKAFTMWPRSASGTPTTAASATAGCVSSALSTSKGPMR